MESITLKKFSGFSNFDVLAFKVRQQLTGKRYLLVLDDLWNEDADQWEKLLQSSLIVGAQGSKILTTIRKRQVADIVKGSISPYFLDKLQADECWSIMEGKAFSPGGALKTPNMISIGKEIADKCSGLPLAAKFLGSLMHSKNEERNWLSIRENDMWNTPECKIIPILKLSYDNLSPHLQRSFSYCSIFPKDWELSKQTLIQLWMAEGFLQPSNVGTNCSFEDIGDEYFESLMWSSYFDGVEKNELDDVTTFKMHDLVHDLAQVVVGDHECSTVKGPDQLEKLSEVRRLNLIMDKELSATFHKTISKLNKLRTVIVLEPNYYLNLCRFSSNNHLRILHLGRPAKDCSGMRYTTSKLRRLRYFHISSMHLNSNLLDDYSFSRLYNLQTLVLSGCALVQNRVKEMGSLNHLRHLDISFSDIKELPDSVTSLRNLQRLDLNHCKNFTTFPDSVIGLEFLRFLDMSFTPIEKIPDFVTSLSHLQTLDINTCKILKTLPEYVAGLNNLSIFNFKNCPLLEALPEDFGELYQLRSLDLEGTQIRILPKSCSNLYNLEYVNLWGCELPKEVANWVKLRKFYYFHMGTPMGIEKLICLRTLSYKVREKVTNQPGIEELGNLHFLEEISIKGLQNVKNPIDAEGANLKAKQNLRDLRLLWDEKEEELDMRWWEQKSLNFQVFEALQPPTGLKELAIYNFMGCNLPTWMCVESGLQNMVRLKFVNCKRINQLPAVIGQLPRLRFLYLTGMSLTSLDIGGFPSLVQLFLTDMFLLENLCYSYPPYLQILEIDGCKSLTDIPLLSSLTMLKLQRIHHNLLCSVGRNQTSLTAITLENIEELIYFPVSILQNNCNLQVLSIKECDQFEGFGVDDENENEVALRGPKLCNVSLQKLDLIDCPILKFLPDLRGWTSLQRLLIFNCPQVQVSLTYDLKSLSFLQYLWVDFIQRNEQQRDPSDLKDLINLMMK